MTVARPDSTAVLLAILLSALSLDARAGRDKTLGFVPDASCRSNALVTMVEDGLKSNFSVKSVKLVEKDQEKASIVIQYFLVIRKQEEGVVIQLDGKAFESGSGKLLAEETADSEQYPDDKLGRESAAKQAGARLAGRFSSSLGNVLGSKGKGRPVMLQVTLSDEAAVARTDVLRLLQQGLSSMAPRVKGSTERNLMLVLTTSEGQKDLVETIEQVIKGGGTPLWRPTWVVQSDNTLILSLDKLIPATPAP